jgi:hypothetical protein
MPGLISVRVSQKTVGMNLPEFIKRLTGESPELRDAVHRAGEASVDVMKEIMLNSGYKLDQMAKAIHSVETFDRGYRTAGISISIEADFPKDEKGREYWTAFNDGWLPPANWGFWDGDKWIHTGKEEGASQGSIYMTPKNPIRPLQFVEHGVDTLEQHLNREIDKYLRSI